jgi:hypothetical protein
MFLLKLERFQDLSLSDSKKSFVIYVNFLSFTKTLKEKAHVVSENFEFTYTAPKFFTPPDTEKSHTDSLRALIEEKEKGGDLSLSLSSTKERTSTIGLDMGDSYEEEFGGGENELDPKKFGLDKDLNILDSDLGAILKETKGGKTKGQKSTPNPDFIFDNSSNSDAENNTNALE